MAAVAFPGGSMKSRFGTARSGVPTAALGIALLADRARRLRWIEWQVGRVRPDHDRQAGGQCADDGGEDPVRGGGADAGFPR